MARKRRRRLKVGRIVAALAIVAALVLAIIFAVKALKPGEGNESSNSSDSSSSSESSSSSQQTAASDAYGAVQMNKDDIHKGDLILVNADAHYVTDKPSDLVTVASKKPTNTRSKTTSWKCGKRLWSPLTA